jgi:hypothetical protein
MRPAHVINNSAEIFLIALSAFDASQTAWLRLPKSASYSFQRRIAGSRDKALVKVEIRGGRFREDLALA